jgi:TatD DNase family protein
MLTKRIKSSFTGNLADVAQIIDLNLFVSLNGASFRDKTTIDAIKQIPKELILLETDSPYCEIRPSFAAYHLVNDDQQKCKPHRFVLG